MNNFSIRYLISFLLLISAQGVIFNHLVLFNVAVPLVFIYLIIMLPVTLGTNLSVLLGFLSGLAVDLFSDTPGVNALACTVLAFARKPLFHLYMSFDDDLAGRSPSSRTMGVGAYAKFVFTMALAYCLMVFTIEAFQFVNLQLTVLRVVASTLYTFVLIFAIDCITLRRREKKL